MTNLTKAGAKMNPATRARIIELLTNQVLDGSPQAEIATEAGISERTLYNYLTPEVWAEIRHLRLQVMHCSLSLVDRAIFYKASHGDVQAAKLIYARWDEVKNLLPPGYHLTNLDDVDQAITSIQQRINALEHPHSPETATPSPAGTQGSAPDPEPAAPLPPQP